jgi:hypothetical protein
MDLIPGRGGVANYFNLSPISRPVSGPTHQH